MNAREYIIGARADPRLADTPIFSALPWLLARSLGEFIPHVLVNAQPTLYQDGLLQSAALDFHRRAETLTSTVREQISNLKAGRIARLSHQPNLFAYMKLVGQFLSLHLLSKDTNLVPLYYFIDYDTLNDLHFSRSSLPDPTVPTGSTRLQLPRSKSHRTAMANQTAKPSKEWLTTTIVAIRRIAEIYSRFNLADGPIDVRLSRILYDLEFAWKMATNVADMNAILLSRFINLWLDLPIPFVPGSFLWSLVAPVSLETEFHRIVQISEALNWAHDELLRGGINLLNPDNEVRWLPWWGICKCNSRVGLQLTENQTAFGICAHCKLEHRFDLDRDYWQKCSSLTAPRILLHNLLNVVGFGYQAGVNHIGSAEHVLTHSLAMTHLSRQPLPQWLWQCSGPFATILESKDSTLSSPYQREAAEFASSGNASFVYFALCASTEALRYHLERKVWGQ